MPSVVRFDAPRQVSLVEEPEKALEPDEVRVRTLYSGISAGTELTAYRGTNPYMNTAWDPNERLFTPGQTPMAYPLDGWGYEEVGEVSEVGTQAKGVAVGDVVWGIWGHRASTTMTANHAAQRVLGPQVSPMLGIFSHIGAIALNVVLDADIHVGETVAVFGLGVPGQLVAQLARLNGARVLAVDPDTSRRDLAVTLGAAAGIDSADGGVAEQIRELTGGRGADVCLEVSGHYGALHEAIRSVAYSSRVVVSGFFQGDGIGLRLGEEAHHNRTQLTVSQIGGVAPAVQHRWDEHRLQSTFMNLASSSTVHLDPLISHRFPIDDVAEAFDLLDRTPAAARQVVLEY